MLRAERVATSVQRAEAKQPDDSGGRDHVLRAILDWLTARGL